MDFSQFDTRNYPTVSVTDGYGEWAETYEDIVQDTMDLRLFGRIQSVRWNAAQQVADLACGTGRIGVWLKQQGAGAVDGIDMTPQMLERATEKGVYRQLLLGDALHTPFNAASYDAVTISLADEHMPSVEPLYTEAARLARPGGHFVIIGFHPFFLMGGIPTHYNRASGEPATIQTYVHLISDHVRAALAAGLTLVEMHEGVIDEEWIARKPKWSQYQNRPVSFAMVWQKRG